MTRHACRLLATVIAAALGVAAAPAHAGRATNTVPAKLTVFAGCSMQTAPLTFVAPTTIVNVLVDSTSNIKIKCTPNTPYTIDIDDGLQPQGNNKRRLRHATLANQYIAYNVYLDALRLKVWGKGATKNYSGNSGTGAQQTIPIYGRVPLTGPIAAGGYKDTLVVTLNF